ncbi:hypothetical protein SCAR479_13809 [Seiridium cardinale]|uniref:Uncharacterized protein n=1 Tax=Seiridium cardinale TaxID=138064 RepID=A0ABR2X6U5_9PEZI
MAAFQPIWGRLPLPRISGCDSSASVPKQLHHESGGNSQAALKEEEPVFLLQDGVEEWPIQGLATCTLSFAKAVWVESGCVASWTPWSPLAVQGWSPMCNDGPSWSAPAAELADLEKAELEKGGSIVVSWAPHHRMPTNFRRATERNGLLGAESSKCIRDRRGTPPTPSAIGSPVQERWLCHFTTLPLQYTGRLPPRAILLDKG